ncbi:MAG: chitobiase/beta-hexosaminidase C-terminal domain-containing protein [Bacteroidales bacterium]|nr:chitobiase/beta-hexosaminidase C-terminal domain-containing protein [Bacteroidales bacterium]
MEKITKNLRWLLASLMLVVGMSSAWAQDPYYTLDTTTDAAKTTSNSYAGTGTVTLNGIEWAVNGNGQMYPWRLGGKSISNTDRTVNTNTAMGSAINKVVLTVGTASSITVNSLKLTVASDASFSTVLDEVTATFAASSDITFEPSTGTEWATGAYYKFTFNVTVSQSSNKFVQFSGVKFYAPEGTGSDPSVAADNVDIAYDATSGQIVYTVSNPVTGGSMSAATTSEWITLSSNYTSPIAFTCTANTSASERSATVTLTYAYGTKTVTKDVTITQAGNPNIVNNISDITETGTYTVKGTIVAKSTRGFIVGDGTGYVYYYNQNYDQSAYNIGDKVKLSGSVVVYGGVYEFNNSTTITAATESNYVEETPSLISGADMDSRVASTTPAQLSSYVQYEGKLSVSGTHYNIIDIDGATTAQGSISYPISTDFTSLDGQEVIVKGYYVGVSSSTYYNTMLGSIEAVAGFVAAPEFDVPEGEYDAAQEVTITCATTGVSIYYTLDGTDPTTSSTVYDGTPITISTTTTLKAIASDGTNLSEITSATYTIDTRIETHIVLNNGTDYESGHTFTITVGDAFTSPEAWVTLPSGVYLNRANSNLTCTGDNDDLATVNSSTGAVTLVSGATGTINVTIEYPGSENYKPCTGSYTVIVNAAITPGDALFNETFAEFSGSGGRDGSFSGSVGASSTANTDESDWTFTSCGGADKCLKFGTGSANGTFITRTITLTGDGTLTFSAAGWGDTKTNTLTVTTNDGNITLSGDTEVTLTNGEWADYTVNIAGATGSFSLTFTGKRGFIDDIKVVTAAPDTRIATTVTLDPATASYNVTLGDAFTAPTAELDPAAAGTLTYESSDETVATVASDGTVNILAAGTTTITAKFAGSDDYKPSQASYTIVVTAPATVYTSLQQLQENVTSTSQEFTLQPATDIYVTALKGTNNAYISDGTYGALIFTNNHGLTAGQKFTGTLSAKFVLYKGATEITNFDATGLTITDGTLAVQTKTIGEITVANQSLPVKFENVTYDAANTQFSDGTNTIKYYDNFSVSPTLVDGHVYDITGIIVMYNNLQIAPLAAGDVEDKTAPIAVEAPVFDPAGGTYTEDKTVTITCATAGSTIFYTLDGTDPTTASTLYTEPVAITTTTTLKAIASDGTNTSTITEATYTINKPTPTTTEAFVLVEDGTITEGDYLIVYDSGAMNTTVEGNRLKFAEVSPDYNNIISTNNASIIWHIAKSGSYYTIYNAAANAYAAGTEVKNNAQMLADGTSDKALWTVEATAGETTFDFTNKANEAKGVNATLRRNGNFGFACYSTLTGDPLSLYKKVSTVSIDLIAAQDNYKTMVAPYDMVVPNISDGIEAYIVTLNSEQTEAYLEPIVNIPAGTPIILHANSAGSYELEKAGTDFTADDVSENVLLVSNGEIEGDGTIFVLNKVNNVVGFYRLNDSMPLATGKCYLKIEKSTDVKFIGFNFDDATGIETVESTNDNLQGTIYNLAGQRVATPAHGLYIVNGKKVLIK